MRKDAPDQGNRFRRTSISARVPFEGGYYVFKTQNATATFSHTRANAAWSRATRKTVLNILSTLSSMLTTAENWSAKAWLAVSHARRHIGFRER
jgi:hypothetical protein